MPRRPRLCAANVPFHVIQRGNNRGDCFFRDADRFQYLSCLQGQAQRLGVAVHAYVLMNNHVHLLMTPTDPDAISQVMKFLGQRYVQYVNRTHERTGSLWEGRFRSSLVDSEAYLLVCHRYIECNPVRAGMVARPADYRWSSHRSNALGERDPLITSHPILSTLGSTAEERLAAYREMFSGELDQPTLAHIRTMTNGGFALGSERFRKTLAGTLGRRVEPAGPGRKPSAQDSGTDHHFRVNGGLSPV